jgi:hypothetical protein
LKWLLNERAAVAGTLTRLLSRRESLVARLARTEQLLARTRIAIAGADSGLATQRQALAALDHALALMHPTVSPAVVGEVVPWAGKYGRKGGLTEFVKSVIKNSYPEPVPTVTIRKLVTNHFNLALETRKEGVSLKKSIQSAIRSLRAAGQTKPVRLGSGTQTTAWVWTANDSPSLRELSQGPTAVRETRRARDEASHEYAPGH